MSKEAEKVLREGFLPQWDTVILDLLADSLRDDDHQLLQGATTCPPPMSCVRDWPCEGACFVSAAHWLAGLSNKVGDVGEAFARACFEADKRLGEPAACRYFLNYWDDTPRRIAFKETLEILEDVLIDRAIADIGKVLAA